MIEFYAKNMYLTVKDDECQFWRKNSNYLFKKMAMCKGKVTFLLILKGRKTLTSSILVTWEGSFMTLTLIK